MNNDLRTLLDDLARYLEQQRTAGSTFYLESNEAEIETPQAVSVVEPASPPQPVAPAPSQAATGQQRDDPFARACEAFVRETLALIAKTRARVPEPAEQVASEPEMFSASAPIPQPPQPSSPPTTPAAKAAALEVIKAEVADCTGCILHGSRRNTVPGAGNPDAGLVLIGEAPGAAEDSQGLPFVGPSGKLLGDILAAVDFARDDVFICNILKCRPPANRDPEPPEVAACESYLRRQLGVIQPRLILCLGRVAAQTLLSTTAPLRDLRSTVHFYAGVPVMATFHPAALLRNSQLKREAWNDVRKLRSLYDALGAVAT